MTAKLELQEPLVQRASLPLLFFLLFAGRSFRLHQLVDCVRFARRLRYDERRAFRVVDFSEHAQVKRLLDRERERSPEGIVVDIENDAFVKSSVVQTP